MAIQTKMKIRWSGDKVEVLVLVNHPMEHGLRVDNASAKRVAAHYIESMRFTRNAQAVADVSLGPDIAQNPMTGIILDHVTPGDEIAVAWTDNRGQQGFARRRVE